MLKAFQIKVNGKILDYRLGKNLNLTQVETFFKRNYAVKKLWSGGRHILGILEKNGQKLFLKLATTDGISKVSEKEYSWNEQFNKLVPRETANFWVPQNKDYGLYNDKLFYLITDHFEGKLLASRPEKIKSSTYILGYLQSVIDFSELIQNLSIASLPAEENHDNHKRFFEKTKAWYNDIPKNIMAEYQVVDLLEIVEENFSDLQKKRRHGDFTPWHLVVLKKGKLGLIDGEHALTNGVQYYDIGYFTQRIFSVLENPDLARDILYILKKRNYSIEKLKVILAARAIGGFLDESLKPSPNYELSNKFKNWVIKLE